MAASLGTLKAKVLIQVGEGEPIEVGEMDIDLVTKAQPVKRGARTAEYTLGVHVEPHLDAEATARKVMDHIAKLGE